MHFFRENCLEWITGVFRGGYGGYFCFNFQKLLDLTIFSL